jgi:hypothetical protein
MAAMMPPAEMVAMTMTTTMAAAMMTAAATTASMATFRDRKVRHGQCRCEDNGGNSHS